MMGSKKYSDIALYRSLLRIAKPYWLHIVGIFLLSLLSIPLALLNPLPLKIAVDSVIGSHPLPRFLESLVPSSFSRSTTTLLILTAGLVVAIALLRQLQILGSWLLNTYTGEKLALNFRAKLFHCVQRLSLSYHDSKGTIDSTYRIQYDAQSIQQIVVTGIFPFITSGFTLIGMIYITALIDWQLALVALAVTPFLFFLTNLSRTRVRSRWAKVKKIESYTMSVVQEALASLRVVKAFGREDQERERFVQHSNRVVRGHIHVARLEGGYGLFVGLVIAIGTAAVLYIGVLHVRSGVLTLGELLLIMGYLVQLYGPLETISRKVTNIQSSLASAKRVFTVLDETPEVVERQNARSLSRASGAIAFQNVSFQYGKDRPVLHNISFEIDPGTRLGIAGKTGAGKTTLVSLLFRFYDPSSGLILLDGIDLRDYKLVDLRNQFGVVLQEPVLFSTSIADNIAYARPGASDQEIIEAAKAANAHEFVVRLPDGYETQVGERGMQLSGGERQRIALARAFLKDAPILILDEPTSSVDMKTEAGIMEAMERLMRGRTTLLITHRLNTLENCDKLLVIEEGRLVNVESDVTTAIRNTLGYGGIEPPILGDKVDA